MEINRGKEWQKSYCPYILTVSKGELVPQITLNALADPSEEWTFYEVAEIMYRQFNQWLNLDLEHSGVRPPNYQINKLPDIPKSPKVNYEKKKLGKTVTVHLC